MQLSLFKSILGCLLLTAPTTPLVCMPSDTHSLPEQTMKEMRQDLLESILKDMVTQLNLLYSIVEDHGVDIATRSISVDNVPQELERIKETKEMIGALKEHSFIELDEYGLLYLSHITQKLIAHVRQAIETNFSHTPPFSLATFRTQPLEDAPSFEDLKTRIAENDKELSRLHRLSSMAGLTWYNKVYRFWDERILQPAFAYKLPHIMGLMGIAGFIGLEIWFNSTSNHTVLRSLLGYPLHLRSNGEIDEQWHQGIDTVYNDISHTYATVDTHSPRPLKLFGRAQHLYHLIKKTITPAVVISTPLLTQAYLKAFTASKQFMIQKIAGLQAILKGGQYKNKLKASESIKTFDDLIGLDHAKSVGRTLIKYLEDPERFSRKNLVPERGYILYGKSRTGKSEFAKALSGEIQKMMIEQGKNKNDFNFFEITTSMLLKEGMKYIYDIATQYAPCILFIDEIDLLGLQRGGGNRELLSEFLSSMSGFVDSDPKKQVIIIAATNKPENIDFALRQRGRFGKALYFDLPNAQHRQEYITKRLNDLSIDTDLFDCEHLAHQTEGATYEDLNAIIKGAFQRAKIDGTPFGHEQLERSIDEEFRNILFVHEHTLSDYDQNMIAAYQLGKAACIALSQSKDKISKITILPIIPKFKEKLPWDMYYEDEKQTQEPIEYGNVFTYCKDDRIHMPTQTQLRQNVSIHLAGTTLQQLLFDDVNCKKQTRDKQNALDIALTLLCQGYNINSMSKEAKQEMINKAHDLVATTQEEVARMLKNYLPQLKAALQLLLEQKMITGEQLQAMLTDQSNAA